MNTSRLDFIALTIAVLLAWTGCQPAPKKSADRKQATPQVQRKADSAKFVTNKDENSIPVRLLASDAVQKDLGLTADQLRKIKEVVQFSKEQLRELAATWQEISPRRAAQMSQARSQELAARGMAAATKAKELQATVVGSLTPSERERLRQIQLQYTMAVALLQPSLIKSLDISNGQLDIIRQQAKASALVDPELTKGLDIPEDELARLRPRSDLIAERGETELQAFDGLTPEETLKRMIERTKERDNALAEANGLALEALTAEQRTKLEEFVGKQIELNWDYDALLLGN